MRDFAEKMIEAARDLGAAVDRIKFTPPVTHVFNPLDYAWRGHEAYLGKFANSRKRVVFLGMNPGPYGMVQTGVPFGETSAVRAWMQIEATVGKPRREHPKRPVEGFACPRSEVSGKRLWGLFARCFGTAEHFFAGHFVVNYCPLAFFDKDGRNLTPDKLLVGQAAPLFTACDRHLRRVLEILQPEWLIGIGGFAEKRARLLLAEIAATKIPPLAPLRIGRILHPSPASPAANRDWARKATNELKALGIWG
jgi:single-strand selective monofunctional uracil DNA glycosylase